MSFLGLGTMAAGLSILLGILLDTGTSLTTTAGWWRNQLALSLSLILVGAPLWIYYWNGILKRMQTGGISEWRALSRRIFLYVIVGVSIIMLAADLVNIIYQLLQGMLQSNLATNYLHNAKWSLQTLIVAALLLWYHWQLLRTDQRRGVEAVVVRKSVTLLADDRTGDLASRLESKLGFKIRMLYQAGQTGGEITAFPEEEIDRVSNEILSAPSNKVMLVVIGGKMTVFPYHGK
jgi:ABC-type multidrug transport system fused ATPase/permease subunit